MKRVNTNCQTGNKRDGIGRQKNCMRQVYLWAGFGRRNCLRVEVGRDSDRRMVLWTNLSGGFFCVSVVLDRFGYASRGESIFEKDQHYLPNRVTTNKDKGGESPGKG